MYSTRVSGSAQSSIALLLVLLLLLGACDSRRSPPLQQLIDALSAHTAQVQATEMREPQQPDAGALALAQWALLALQEDPQRLPELIAKRAALLFDYIDPVWRGVLERRSALLQSTSAGSAFATRIESQSAALKVFAAAYWLTGEQRFRTAFGGIDGYLQDWLRGSNGKYAAGQALQPPSLRRPFTAADYWQLRREHDRRQLGLPAAQGSASAVALAELGLSYLIAADAFRDDGYLVEAGHLAEASLSMVPSNLEFVEASLQNCRTAPKQLQLLINLYERTGADIWLRQAEDLSAALVERWAQQPSCANHSVAQPEKGMAYIELALALRSLALINRDSAFVPLLEPLLRASQLQTQAVAEHQALALAGYERALRGGFVAIQVNGQLSDPRTQDLLAAARHTWHARKVIIPVSLTESAALSLPRSPGAFVCNTQLCAPAALTPKAVSAAIVGLRHPNTTAVSEQVSYFLGSSLTTREAVDE